MSATRKRRLTLYVENSEENSNRRSLFNGKIKSSKTSIELITYIVKFWTYSHRNRKRCRIFIPLLFTVYTTIWLIQTCLSSTVSTKFISKFLIANGSGYALKLPFISRQGILSPLKFMMESSMNATSAVFLVSNVSNNMASIMSVMDDSGNLTSLAANINKSSNNQELHQRMCPTGFHENTEDLMCMKKINFDEQYKNPCWNPKVDDLACLPYFMIIGMQKCGTTDLFRAMIKHVNIIPPRDRYGDMVKETHFFDAFHYGHKLDDFEPRQYLSFKDYRNMFSSLSTKIKKGNTNFITGEATPAYLWRLYTWKLYPQNKNKTKPIVLLPDLVRHIIPNVKLIIVLRDPVDRSRSSYFYSHSPKKPVEAFDKAFLGGLRLIKDCFKVKTEVECILNDTLIMPFRKQVDHILPGLYYYFIKEWFRAFPREQFMIINFKDYKNNKTKTLNRIFKFLELSTLTEEEMINSGMITKQAKNRGRQIRLSSLNSSTVSKLQEFFRPYNKLLLNLLNSSSFDWT